MKSKNTCDQRKLHRGVCFPKADLMAVLLSIACFAVGHSARADYPGTILLDDPLVYWRFSGTTGNLTNSATGTNAITVTAAPQNAEILGSGNQGPIPPTYSGFASDNLAGKFTGTASTRNVQISGTGGTSGALHDALNGKAGYTVEAWINPSSLPSGANKYAIAFMTGQAGNAGFLLDLTSTGIRIGGRSGNGDSFKENTWTMTLNTGTWYNVVATMDFASAKINLYVNGVSQGAYSVSGWGSSTFAVTNTNHYASIIGAYNVGDLNTFFRGSIDEFSIYNNVLSSSQITAHYNAAVPEPSVALLLGGAGLVCLLKLRHSKPSSGP